MNYRLIQNIQIIQPGFWGFGDGAAYICVRFHLGHSMVFGLVDRFVFLKRCQDPLSDIEPITVLSREFLTSLRKI